MWQVAAARQLLGHMRFLLVLSKNQLELLQQDGELPSNVRVSSFVPQLELLGHASLVGFHTHGGANSVNDAVVHGKPIVCSPFDGDQPENCLRAEDAGFAVLVQPTAFMHNVALLSTAYSRLVSDSSLLDNARRLQQLSQLAGGRERAADIVLAHARLGSAHLTFERQGIEHYLLYLVGAYLVWLLLRWWYDRHYHQQQLRQAVDKHKSKRG